VEFCILQRSIVKTKGNPIGINIQKLGQVKQEEQIETTKEETRTKSIRTVRTLIKNKNDY